jgi:hypothetical protein
VRPLPSLSQRFIATSRTSGRSFFSSLRAAAKRWPSRATMSCARRAASLSGGAVVGVSLMVGVD